jgi:Polysaccharide pyruvyl transferase
MNVGILSLTSGYNFGGTLQTWALSRSLAAMGHDPVVIDYHPSRRCPLPWWRGWGIGKGISPDRIRHRALELVKMPAHITKYQAFKSRHLAFTCPCHNAAEVLHAIKDFDAVIVGSDQVWNLEYHPDPVFYLSGMDSFKGLRLSYAACCGNPTQGFPNWVAPALREFHAMSVRNRFTADWVSRCTTGVIEPEVVADPTLLIDDYPRCALELPDRYIAAYHIGKGDDSNHRRHIENLRKTHGNLPIVCLMPTAIALKKSTWHDQVLWNLDPFEWVEAIRRANAVYTDSYHAILFALRNRIPVLATYTEEVRAPRLWELREKHNLQSTIIPAVSESVSLAPPDWVHIGEQFAADREHSFRFLKAAMCRS